MPGPTSTTRVARAAARRAARCGARCSRRRGSSDRAPSTAGRRGASSSSRISLGVTVRRRTTRAAFARVISAISSGSTPRARASAAPTATTSAGSFGLPRYGSGVRNGESVSTSTRSAGVMRAASRSVVGVLERDDAAERQVAPAVERQRVASSGPPVKQWKIVRSGTPSSSSTRNVSSHASREWITSGLPVCFARRIWNRNAVSCSSRGECS